MIVLYHANCNDGSAAALAVWMKHGDNGHKYIAVIHGQPPPNEVVGENVLIVDFCYPKDVLLNMGAKSIHILDHHVSAKKDLADPFPADKNITSHFDMTRSGAVLSWQYCFPDKPVPTVFQYVEDRDIWNNAYKESVWLYFGLEVFSQNFREWQQLVDDQQKLNQTIQNGKAIYTHVLQECDKLMEHRTLVEICGHQVPTVNAPSFMASDLLHNILKAEPSAPFAAAYCDFLDKGIRYFSLRSEDHREDVSVIAKKLGGGGHRNASGFSVPLPPLVL